MNYSPTIFAKSFFLAIKEAPNSEHPKLMKNFLRLLKKYGAEKDAHKIVTILQKMASRAEGTHRISIVTARALDKKTMQAVKHLFSADRERPSAGAESGFSVGGKEKNVFTESLNPDLLAGIKITIDDELVLDNSMKRKLKNLFAQ